MAYADFAMATMALFIVLGLHNSSKRVREAVGGYFKDPTGTPKKVGNGQVGAGDNFVVAKDNMGKNAPFSVSISSPTLFPAPNSGHALSHRSFHPTAVGGRVTLTSLLPTAFPADPPALR